jgi:hypothetical protein
MNIVVAQFYTSNVSYGPYAEAINKKYCDEKGYTYFCEKDDNKINSSLDTRAPTWYKPKLAEDIISQFNPDYILFLDIDAIISDFNQNIEDFIDSNYNMVFAEDVGHHSVMNAGVFLLKNNEWSRNFLKTWWDSAENYKGKDARDLSIMEENLEKVGYFKQALWHDQTCLTMLYESNEDVKNNIKVISNRSFNYREYNKDNFIFHAFAYGHSYYRTLDIIYKEKFESSNSLENINLIVYHIYCVGNYIEVATKQLNRLKTSGLYDWCNKLEITCINTLGDFSAVEELVKDLDKVTLNKFTNNSYEYEGINKVWEYSQQYKGKVLYFHTKGVSNIYNNLEEKKESSRKKQGINWWKEAMEYFLIDNYQDCLLKLDEYDQCGVTNNNKWWWGNFWWANLSFIRANSKPHGGDRWYFEAWLNHHRNPSVYEFYHFEFNPYYTKLPNDIYIDKDKYKDSKIEVVSAYYGTLGEQQDEGKPLLERIVVDVTKQIKSNLVTHNNKGFCINVDNNIAGDPYFGVYKALEIYFTIDEEECVITVDENQNLKFLL